MKKTIISIITVVLAVFTLTGCGCKHEWIEATCLTPRTCALCGKTEGEVSEEHNYKAATCLAPMTCIVCGETEGEPAPHDYIEATCTTPKTCRVCGATEGTAPGHDFKEADYDNPKTCKVCGMTEGEPLQPDFVLHGLECNMELGTAYPYLTTCYDNQDYTTLGTVSVTDYEKFDNDDTHPGAYGYEWKSIIITFVYNDQNANDYGTMSRNSNEDYYDIEAYDDSIYYDETADITYYAVKWHGETFNQCKRIKEVLQRDWVDDTYTYQVKYSYNIPVGYDGTVISVYEGSKEWLDGQHIYDIADEDTMFFRLK